MLDVDEVCLAEAARRLTVGRHRLGHVALWQTRHALPWANASLKESRIEVTSADLRSRLVSVGQLTAVVADAGDLVGDDQMVFGVHGGLNVVANDACRTAIARH